MRHILAAASLLALTACGYAGQDNEKTDAPATTAATDTGTDYGYQTYGADNLADTMASNDGGDMAGATSSPGIPDSQQRPVMQAQVVLDRLGFTPGVIDGKEGMSTTNALEGFQEAKGLQVTGKLDDQTKTALGQWSQIPATRVVTIPTDWGSAEYYATPDKAAEQAKMKRLGYTSLDERLAERFHTTIDTLKMLNPDGRPAGMKGPASGSPGASPTATATVKPTPTATPTGNSDGDSFTPKPGPASFFKAGQQIRVPNIGADKIAPGSIDDQDWQRTLASLGVGTEQPQAAQIVVSKAGGTLKAYDADKKLIAEFTVTTGSSHDPLPLGDWKITGIAHNPPFEFNPDLLWDVPKSEEKQQIPPGPNGPVGVVWIALSKEHYGIHGTPEPQTIGRVQSHGCVRLTNWDAARLAQMVSQKTKVSFKA